jgi:2-methylcitrate dehydratase PrpD
MDQMQSTGKWPSRVQVVTRTGNLYEAFVEYPKGSPQNPLTDTELRRKFTRLTDKILGKKQIEEIIQTVNNLENAKNVNSLVHLLV